MCNKCIVFVVMNDISLCLLSNDYAEMFKLNWCPLRDTL